MKQFDPSNPDHLRLRVVEVVDRLQDAAKLLQELISQHNGGRSIPGQLKFYLEAEAAKDAIKTAAIRLTSAALRQLSGVGQ